jgi:predicted nucleic acid-binding protein
MKKKQKIYLDTSIINFLFADDAPEKKEITIEFFENYLNDYHVSISEIVITEINRTPNLEKRNALLETIKKYNIEIYDEVNDTINLLAKEYIKYKIIPENKFPDAQHIAFSVYYEFDVLLSWNFKHLANLNKQLVINELNRCFGYFKPILLLNPMEVIYEK